MNTMTHFRFCSQKLSLLSCLKGMREECFLWNVPFIAYLLVHLLCVFFSSGLDPRRRRLVDILRSGPGNLH